MTRPLRLLIASLNHAPELVGIGPYSADLARDMVRRGHRVTVVTAPPFYPAWRVESEWRTRWFWSADDAGVRVVRCPLYVPARPSGARRIAHHLSFLASSAPALIQAALALRPDVVLAVAPSLIAAPAALATARLVGAKAWLHIQDFELDAAQATGLIAARDGPLLRAGRAFERGLVTRFDRVSTISPQMCALLAAKGVAPDRIIEVRNGADVADIAPLVGPSPYRAEWNVRTPHVALYSGNLGHKQGVEILVEAARRLAARGDVTTIICGDGPTRAGLEVAARDLPLVQFRPLQPRARLSELLNLATVHLLPQRREAADLVLPSKLGNMLASGRPIVATADPGTGVAEEVAGCGIVAPPGDAAAFATGIAALLDDPERAARLGAAGRRRAEGRWATAAILDGFEAEVLALAGISGSSAARSTGR